MAVIFENQINFFFKFKAFCVKILYGNLLYRLYFFLPVPLQLYSI